MEQFIMHLDYGKKLVWFSIAVVIITVVVHIIFNKKRFIRYIPGIILFIISLYYLLILVIGSQPINQLNKISVMGMAMVTSIVALGTGLIIGVWEKEIE